MKLITLNVNRSNFLDRNIPFLCAESSDVMCLQEFMEADRELFERETGLKQVIYFRNTLTDGVSNGSGKEGYSGCAIFAKESALEIGGEYFYMPPQGIVLQQFGVVPLCETNAYGVAWAKLRIHEKEFVIATLHFTWTKNGVVDEYQTKDFVALKTILAKLPKHVLTGDLNAPRGNGMWEKFVELYDGKDNILQEIDSTIDPSLHRAKGLKYIVDGIFAHDTYSVSNVRVVQGVSDHCAVIAEIDIT